MDREQETLPNLKELAENLDTEGMLGHIRRFPADFETAVARDLSALEHLDGRKWAGLLCVGMGGSASGGDFLAALAQSGGTIPVLTSRDYTLPEWWNSEWLVVATSYSGGTEETMSLVREVAIAGGHFVAITSGGELAKFADKHGVPLLEVPAGQPPRSAFGHLFGTQLALAIHLGVIQKIHADEFRGILKRLRDCITKHDFTADAVEVHMRELCEDVSKRGAVIIAPEEMRGAGYRFRCQLNENGGIFARDSILPEMNHNELVAWGEVDSWEGIESVLILTHANQHPRVVLRTNWLMQRLPAGHAWRLDCEGRTLLEALLQSVVMMDWVSCGVSLLRGKDPTSIGPITSLKEHLSNK